MTIQGDFTRRKNWSQNILEELRDIVHVLSVDAKILSCSPASSEFLGYQPAELVGRTLTDIMHDKDVQTFLKEYSQAFASKQPLRIFYRLMRKDGKHTSFETSGHFVQNCFIGVARCTSVQATRTMDKLLDLKVEHRMLKQQLARIKSQKKAQETHPDMAHAHQISDPTLSGPIEVNDNDDSFLRDLEEMINDPCVYTLGVSASCNVSQSLSLFTGLHYETGERSKGISMGLEGELLTMAPELAPEEPVIQIASIETQEDLAGQERRTKKKRVEPDQPKICIDCGTTDAPEWRRGPQGPKTLCNACGLRWAKTSKKPD